MAAVEAAALTKRYGTGEAVSDVSVSLAPGSCTAIVGPNGSGKTTLLHMLSGLLRPTSGVRSVHGVPVDSDSAKPLIGFAPDDLPLPLSLTGDEMVGLTLRLRRCEPVIDVDRVLHILGILQDMDRPIGQYSHGMKRKLQLVCAVMHGPRVLFLDEPYRGLDPMSEMLLRRLIRTIVEGGATVVSSTHSLEVTGSDYDHLLVMDDGRLVAAGRVSDLLVEHGAANVTELFLRVTGRDSSARLAEDDLAEEFRRIYATTSRGSDDIHATKTKMESV